MTPAPPPAPSHGGATTATATATTPLPGGRGDAFIRGAKTGPPSPDAPAGGGVHDRTAEGGPPTPDASILFDALADSPLKITSVRLRGLHRTRRSVVERELANLGGAASVGAVREALLADWGVLAGLGCFSAVELALEECEPVRRM